MTETTHFVAELIRASSEIKTLTSLERHRLLDRATSIIWALRDLLDATGKVVPTERGIGKELHQLSAMLHNIPDEIVAHALLHAADEIRRLRILAYERHASSRDNQRLFDR
ncbi:hypothetical protein [Rhizobium sp. BK251]|uniref:hypothetical protein n=1 Tax=Rhizobium sp. BK251 TaxID=2512125 RepID=UPI00104726CC|nr:hypothetical protein [Rhizobium sp. BK251]TCL66388.1 hypothetical protein EV286_11199 [Rhizobium sp. BK251]